MAYIFEHFNNKQPQEKSATPTTSAQNITPDAGKYLSKVSIGAIQTEEKTATANGAVTPSTGKLLSKVTVNVPATPTQEKTATITENGTTTVTPDSGKAISKVTITTNVPSIEDVATTATLTAKLVAANVGKAYRFTGTTDDTYTNGDLYVVVNE